jgi:hypothetical protein
MSFHEADRSVRSAGRDDEVLAVMTNGLRGRRQVEVRQDPFDDVVAGELSIPFAPVDAWNERFSYGTCKIPCRAVGVRVHAATACVKMRRTAR